MPEYCAGTAHADSAKPMIRESKYEETLRAFARAMPAGWRLGRRERVQGVMCLEDGVMVEKYERRLTSTEGVPPPVPRPCQPEACDSTQLASGTANPSTVGQIDALHSSRESDMDQERVRGKMSATEMATYADPNVPLDRLRSEEAAYLATLRRQIEAGGGVLEPMVLRELPDGGMIIEEGMHRLAVALDLGIDLPYVVAPLEVRDPEHGAPAEGEEKREKVAVIGKFERRKSRLGVASVLAITAAMAGAGLGGDLVGAMPRARPREPKVMTPQDEARLEAAREKRERRQARRQGR